MCCLLLVCKSCIEKRSPYWVVVVVEAARTGAATKAAARRKFSFILKDAMLYVGRVMVVKNQSIGTNFV